MSLKIFIFGLCMCFMAGVSDGYNQVTYAHYGAFKAVHPNANDNFWNPAISWVNKYKDYPADQREKFVGSKTIFVAFTDAYHITRQALTFFLMFGVAVCALSAMQVVEEYRINLNTLAYIFLVFVACIIAKISGFTLIYNVIY